MEKETQNGNDNALWVAAFTWWRSRCPAGVSVYNQARNCPSVGRTSAADIALANAVAARVLFNSKRKEKRKV